MRLWGPGPPSQTTGRTQSSCRIALHSILDEMGCSKCRYSMSGCKQCRNPLFKGRRTPCLPPPLNVAANGTSLPSQEEPRNYLHHVRKSKRARRGAVEPPGEMSLPLPHAAPEAPEAGPSRTTRPPPPPPSRLLVTAGDPRTSTYEPPPSPYSLIEEVLYSDPWKLLVATILLNKTSATMVRSILGRLFHQWPTPQAMRMANEDTLSSLLWPLGLYRKRAMAIKRMSGEYLDLDWRNPQELYMCGRYASDAYFIFCRGQWRDMEEDPPRDKDLKRYWDFLVATEGQGSGLEREREEDLLRHVPSSQPLDNPQPSAVDPVSPSQHLSLQEGQALTGKSTPEERRVRLKVLLSSTGKSHPTQGHLPVAVEDPLLCPV